MSWARRRERVCARRCSSAVNSDAGRFPWMRSNDVANCDICLVRSRVGPGVADHVGAGYAGGDDLLEREGVAQLGGDIGKRGALGRGRLGGRGWGRSSSLSEVVRVSGGGLWVVHWFLGAASGDGGIIGAAGRGSVIGGVIFLSWGRLFRRIVTLGLRGGRLTGEGGCGFFRGSVGALRPSWIWLMFFPWGSVGPFRPSWIWLGCSIP